MLTFADIVQGLNRFRSRYDAIDVFADDVRELAEGTPVLGLALDPQNPNHGVFHSRDGNAYALALFPDRGILRLSRLHQPEATQAGDPALVGAFAGAVAGTVLAAKNKKGEGAAVGLLLGLLVGAAFEPRASSPHAPQRIFTMRFDPLSREWQAYDGGLVTWAANELFLPA
ncbi:MAG: hypothetical protein MUF64_16340 [Polyangiaceae bacterium]|jgi:hypothetical protein|nr:hypothetical protein [Polyangiaceae bacterium]